MRCVLFRRFGGPEVLEYTEAPEPTYGPDDVVVEVHAVSVNRTLDLEVRRNGAGWQGRVALPHIPGADPAGVVVACGANARQFRPGDHVVVPPMLFCGTCEACRADRQNACSRFTLLGVHRDGGAADYVAVPARCAVPIPRRLNFEQASAMALIYPVAWNLLRHAARLQPGETVAVLGAGGALGTAGIGIAKALGTRVIAVSGSDAKLERCRTLGADAAVNRHTPDLAAEIRRLNDGRGVDVVYENVGSPTLWPASIGCLAHGGRLVTCGTVGGGTVQLDLRHLYRNDLSIHGIQGHTHGMTEEVFGEVTAGRIPPPVIGRRFALQDAATAHAYMEAGEQFGRVCLINE